IGSGPRTDPRLFVVIRYLQCCTPVRDPTTPPRASSTRGGLCCSARRRWSSRRWVSLLVNVASVHDLVLAVSVALLSVMTASVSLLRSVRGFVGRATDRPRIPDLHSHE